LVLGDRDGDELAALVVLEAGGLAGPRALVLARGAHGPRSVAARQRRGPRLPAGLARGILWPRALSARNDTDMTQFNDAARSRYSVQDYKAKRRIEGVEIVELKRFNDDGGSM